MEIQELIGGWSVGTYLWVWFTIATIGLLALDIYQMKKDIKKEEREERDGLHEGVSAGQRLLIEQEAQRKKVKSTIKWTLAWVAMAGVFLVVSVGIMMLFGGKGEGIPGGSVGAAGSLWLTGYIVERSLSVDNLFVFLLLFSSLAIAKRMQSELLLYGIIGAIVLRLLMIFGAATLVAKYSWILIIFGVFLVIIGVKTWPKQSAADEKEEEPKIVKLLSRLLPVKRVEGYYGRENGKLYLTTGALALLSIALIDVIFAVDSIPAIFAITTDTWIIASSNVFAVLGLRPMYFLLQHLKDKLEALPYALSVILVFIGIKLLISPWLHIPVWLSLSVIIGALSWAGVKGYMKAKSETVSVGSNQGS